MSNARLADIRFHMLNTKNSEFQRYAEYEEVSFTYQKFRWAWTDSGIATQDDWAQ